MPYKYVYRYPCVIKENGIELEVGEYCKVGPDIIDSLLTNEVVLTHRGRNEIDHNSSNRVMVSGNCKLHTWVQPGVLTTIEDSQLGLLKGILRTFSLNISRNGDNATATTSIKIERESNE